MFVSRYWGPSEPSEQGNGIEKCVQIKTFHSLKSWNNAECRLSFRFICEKMIKIKWICYVFTLDISMFELTQTRCRSKCFTFETNVLNVQSCLNKLQSQCSPSFNFVIMAKKFSSAADRLGGGDKTWRALTSLWK